MKYAFCIIVALGFGSTAHAGLNDKLPPEAYLDPIDQQIARMGKGVPGRPLPCAYERNGGAIIESEQTDLCVRMLPQQRWRGLWLDATEGSTFCPQPATDCPSSGEKIWLDSGPGRGGHGDLYRVDFLGRKTMYKGPYGHLGMFDQEVVMDRAISIQLVKRGWGWPRVSK